MAIKAAVFSRHEGGWSTDLKVGISHSVPYTEALDFRKNPSQLSVLPGLAKESGSVVTDLVQNFVMVPDGSIYALGDTGNFYKRTTAGVWSLIGNIGSGTFGMDYRRDSDIIYMTGTTTVSTYGPVLGTPTLTVDKYAASVATANTTTSGGVNVNPNQTGSGFVYTPPTAISESAVNRRYFQSDIEPLSKVSVYIQTKGTGNWTVTLHDGLDNTLATSMVANASLMNNAFNDFTFSTPQRIYVSPSARTYHIHVTSTVADGNLTTSANGDLQGADLQVYANRLIATTNGLHPMIRFQQYECIGNGNYLSVWEPLSEPPTNSEWLRHRLAFPQEYEVCGLAVFNEYIAVALQKVSTASSSDPQEGLIAWWDGLSEASDNKPNYFTKIPEGTPQAIREYKNNIYYYAGGDWYRISSPNSIPEKVRRMPGSDTEYSGANSLVTIYPNAATVRRGILLMAYPCVTTNTSINFGIYSWGSVDKNLPESFGYSYVISSGTKNYTASNNLTIGAAKNFGDTLLVSWRDSSGGGGYGVDVVSNASAPAAAASWQSLVLDNGMVSKPKTGIYFEVPLATFPADASLVLKYKIDRGAWVPSSSFTLANTPTQVCRLNIVNPNRYKELQLGFDVTSGTTTPVITSPALVFNDNREERLS